VSDDKITFRVALTKSQVEEELLKIAVPAGIEVLSILWSRTDLTHEFNTGETRRYLERERPELYLGPKAGSFVFIEEGP